MNGAWTFRPNGAFAAGLFGRKGYLLDKIRLCLHQVTIYRAHSLPYISRSRAMWPWVSRDSSQRQSSRHKLVVSTAGCCDALHTKRLSRPVQHSVANSGHAAPVCLERAMIGVVGVDRAMRDLSYLHCALSTWCLPSRALAE